LSNQLTLSHKNENTLKPSTTLIFAGIALLFLAAFYSIAPALMLFLRGSVNISYELGRFTGQDIFAWNYFISEILGIIFLLLGTMMVLREKKR